MATLQSLADDMRKAADNVKLVASEAAVEVTKTILADVAVRTPVDKGETVSEWQLSLISPPSARVNNYEQGKGGSTAQSNVDSVYSKALSVLENKKPGESIFISNVFENIERLNRGSSTQAPAGFVERAVMLGKNKLKNVKVKLVHSGR